MRILIVDDSFDQRTLLSLFLNNDFVEVIEAEGGDEAFKIFEQGGLDLIISDLEMPKGSGLDLLKSVRATSDLPFILLSGNPGIIPSMMIKQGATAFLSKPYKFRDISEILNRIFGNNPFGSVLFS